MISIIKKPGLAKEINEEKPVFSSKDKEQFQLPRGLILF